MGQGRNAARETGSRRAASDGVAKRAYEPPRVVRLGVAQEGSGQCTDGSSTTSYCQSGAAAPSTCQPGSTADQYCAYSGSTAGQDCYDSGLSVG